MHTYMDGWLDGILYVDMIINCKKRYYFNWRYIIRDLFIYISLLYKLSTYIIWIKWLFSNSISISMFIHLLQNMLLIELFMCHFLLYSNKEMSSLFINYVHTYIHLRYLFLFVFFFFLFFFDKRRKKRLPFYI